MLKVIKIIYIAAKFLFSGPRMKWLESSEYFRYFFSVSEMSQTSVVVSWLDVDGYTSKINKDINKDIKESEREDKRNQHLPEL